MQKSFLHLFHPSTFQTVMCVSEPSKNVDTKVDTNTQAALPRLVTTKSSGEVGPSRGQMKHGNDYETQPWYTQGGMKEINTIGMAINIVTTLYIIASQMSEARLKCFFTGLLVNSAISAIKRKTLYCILVIPTFFTSLLLCTSLDNNLQVQVVLLMALCLAITKVNICMSVCYHRYAAHSAFKCGHWMNLIVLAIGCLAWQGGPIWWASQHRRHHKHCDIKGDPHSPVLDGIEKAFSFFERHADVDEEYLPNHINANSRLVRLLDTWSWVFVFLELRLAHYLFGLEGLFISFTSGWMCQAITLWFNVVNHPPDGQSKSEKEDDLPSKKKKSDFCKATDTKDAFFADLYIPFLVLDHLHPLFGVFVKEGEHKHHHDHARLAKRSKYDVAYWGFVWPLEQVGLVWNVIS